MKRQATKTPRPLDAPLVDLHELKLRSPMTAPGIFLAHREHHGVPVLNAHEYKNDKPGWAKIKPEQQGVIVHVLQRMRSGFEMGVQAIPVVEKSSDAERRGLSEHYAALLADTKFIVDACGSYILEVAGKREDEGALTPAFRQIFQARLPELIGEVANSSPNRRDRIRAQARLRTVHHIVGQGLGAITGVWGINAGLHQLANPAHPDSEPVHLEELKKLIGLVTLIERRSLMLGLYEMGELARQAYVLTVLSVAREFRSIKPVLDTMRDDTFRRWGEQFPFDIDKDELAWLAKKRVIGWMAQNILGQPSCITRRRIRTLADIL